MKTHISLTCLLICLGLVQISLAAESSLRVESSKCACDTKISDPYERPVLFNFGPYQGQCVNSCKYRGVVGLSDDPKQGELKVANILHENEYWVAQIPTDKALDVSIIFEEFAPRISHVALRFHFSADKPIRLKSQLGSKKTTIQDLFFSAEGTPPRGESYSLMAGARRFYFLSYRFFSLEQAVQSMVISKKHLVKQFHLNLTPSVTKQILLSGLKMSEEKSLNEIYDLFSNNCATSALDLIDKKTGHQESWFWQRWERALPIDLFFGTIHALERRGLLDPVHDRMENLGSEVKHPLAIQE